MGDVRDMTAFDEVVHLCVERCGKGGVNARASLTTFRTDVLPKARSQGGVTTLPKRSVLGMFLDEVLKDEAIRAALEDCVLHGRETGIKCERLDDGRVQLTVTSS